MSNIDDTVGEKYKSQIKRQGEQIQNLKDSLSNQKAQIDVEKEHLRAKNSVLTTQLKAHLLKERREREYVEEVKTAVKALDPLPKFNIIKPKISKTPMTAVIHLTDWHIGEYISSKETEGWGNFSWEVAQDRIMGQFLPDVLKWLDTQRHGYTINDIQLLCTGDFISGDIHDELRRTNEFPIPVQTACAGDLLGNVGRELAAHCEHLTVTEIGADNHSRLVQKPQAKQKTQNSMSTLVYHIANKEMSRLSNVEIDMAEGMKHLFKINGHPFLGEHGDTVKSWMGVPWYGMERERAREATRRMFGDKGFKYLIMGHWHQPWFGLYIIGGCLSGTSEYDHSCGRVSAPAQTAFLVGKHGAFAFVPFGLR